MQYILTEEEYTELKNRGTARLELKKKGLQKLCTKICNEMPVKFWGNKEARPWRCMITVEEESEGMEWYCDQCPVEDICPYEFKSHSK